MFLGIDIGTSGVKVVVVDDAGRGRFISPVTATGTVVLTPAQLSMLLEGIDWRRPERTFTPTLAG